MDNFGRSYTNLADELRLLIYRRDDVHRFLTWIGRIPHPLKEALRLWTLRILRENSDQPIRWRKVEAVKHWLDYVIGKAAETGRLRAKEFYEVAQPELDLGVRGDAQPKKAQTAPHLSSYKTNQQFTPPRQKLRLLMTGGSSEQDVKTRT